MYYSNEGIRLQHSSYENIIVTHWNKLEMILIKKWEKGCPNFHWGKIDNQEISKKNFWLSNEKLREARSSNAFWYQMLFGILNLQQLSFCCYFVNDLISQIKVPISFPNFSKILFSFHKIFLQFTMMNKLFCMLCWL